jgi:virginiamycin B lyase
VTQSNGVARFSPADPLGAEFFQVLAISDPRSIVTGSDGNLWTASGDQVVKIPPGNPTGFTAYPVTGLSARGIASGGDGSLWVADFGGKRVLSVTTAGATTPYDVGGGVQEVAAGPGNQIAYANPRHEPAPGGRIVPGGTPQKTDVGTTDPFGIAFGPDGARTGSLSSAPT